MALKYIHLQDNEASEAMADGGSAVGEVVVGKENC
jgi:hypothetical protein